MNKNLTSVRGIRCWGAHTGVKSMRRDLAIIHSEVPAATAAVFTRNRVVAEPVKLSRRHLRDHRAQAIVCNAGNANACTGKAGAEGARAMARATAEQLGIDERDVVVASTGLIGAPFPTEDIVDGIRENVPKLSKKAAAGTFTANAILTTDTFAKEGFLEFEADGYEINLAGIAKGSGMIHPNMATMLAFIVCDIAIEPRLLQRLTRECVDESFNMITVDGDTSTNDMVVVMANGLAENPVITDRKDPGCQKFRDKLLELMVHLAKLIVSDGEGATKFIEYRVRGARSKKDARTIARTISDSTLVKAAMFGRDPNWGRVLCAAGNAGVDLDPSKVDLFMGDTSRQMQVLDRGAPVDLDRNALKKLLRNSHIQIDLDLHEGRATAVAWGADLSTDYVLFNSVYTT
ncbi:MAG: bifunctional glutamate N-acetyltransferase/amino-acid acetyltransferase ArgJ [Flavobacteriales bacterium]|nr:bifunctional glutamate N-acetyltransferase/amino-acid acetyltransferase ArgJ [Flavobacteriales bacterium]